MFGILDLGFGARVMGFRRMDSEHAAGCNLATVG